jgi:hypothetical protein
MAEAEERRILAEERLADLRVSLAAARQRSVNAHESAARMDDGVGRTVAAQQHRDAADADRQLIDREAAQADEWRQAPQRLPARQRRRQ